MGDVTPLTRTTSRAAEAGRERRNALPRKDLGMLAPRPLNFDPVALIQAQGVPRVPDLLPLRHQRMAANEFAFLRGSAGTMAYDLALTPSTGLDVQLCGDAHVANFGVFLSPERRLVFDVNDFDETLPGPFEWDVKRLVASAAVALSAQGHSEKAIVSVVRSAAESYRVAMRDLAQLGNLDVWNRKLDLETNLDELRKVFVRNGVSAIDAIIAKAQRSSSKRSFQKMVAFDGGRLRFLSDPPVLVPYDEIMHESGIRQQTNFTGLDVKSILEIILEDYSKTLISDRAHLLTTYEPVDLARKVVGVGSVGTRCFVFLLLGRDMDDPLILQIKEAMPSVLESHLGPSHFDNSGQRVVEGQRLMQTTPDAFLGYVRVHYSDTESHDFYIRQFHDGKASPDIEVIEDAELFKSFVNVCASTLARAHARSGDRAAIAAYLGNSPSFDKAMVEFALAYVERNRADYGLFCDAIAEGRIEALPQPTA